LEPYKQLYYNILIYRTPHKYYAEEADNCAIYSNASFTKNKNEYLPIPFAQISASNGNYTQNCGGW